jgi:hypothetical protein
MDKAREYVERMYWEDRIEIVKDIDEFERTGVTGDTHLRRHTTGLAAYCGLDNGPFTLWSTILIAEVYRFYAMRYLRDHNLIEN